MNRTLAAAVSAALVLVACGGGDDSVTTTTPAVTTTQATTTTVPATSATSAETTTTEVVAPAEPVLPLTGLPLTDENLLARPALAVKIDDNTKAQPQFGINQADLVYEEIVEVGTRFAAVFHSQSADPVGPIRSGRTQDIDLLGSLNRPLLAWSGGNRRVQAAVASSDLVDLRATGNVAGRAYYRGRGQAPHNLYSSTDALWLFAPPDAAAPQQQFAYRAPGESSIGDIVTNPVTLNMGGTNIRWSWDSESGEWRREERGRSHLDADGRQIGVQNLVIIFTGYRPSAADSRSPEAITLGEGDAWVFSDGKLVLGRWLRTDRLQPFQFLDPSGVPIPLTPGRTWIELAEPGSANV